MESSLKRKRTPVIYEISDDSESESKPVLVKCDADYEPESKKKKVAAKPERKVKKEPKIKSEAKKRTVKPKVQRKKAAMVTQDAEIDSKPNLAGIASVKAEFAPSLSNLPAKSMQPLLSNINKVERPWSDAEVVAEMSHISVGVARNIIGLLDQECTLPFIVRYRRQQTGGLQAEKLREVQESYEEVKHVHKKVENILKSAPEKFDPNVTASFLAAKSLEEVELLYAPFKSGSKKTLAEKSKQLGLEGLALDLLEGRTLLCKVNFQSLIQSKEGLKSREEIQSGFQHIIADKVSKDRQVLDFIREKIHHPGIRLACSKSAGAEKKDRQANVDGKTTQNFKYENYYDLNILVKNVASHQVMAINRGEKQKVLKVKIQFPLQVEREILDNMWRLFSHFKYWDAETSDFLRGCFQDSYSRLIEPYMCRQIRSELSKKAEKDSINCFGSNVRSLLLTPPVRGKVVLGIDPGFAHGCKVAVISPKGEVQSTNVIYPHRNKLNKESRDAGILQSMVFDYGAEIIAIGNGTACRETEVWISNLIKSNHFQGRNIKYCIVNESGASIYSVTKDAEADLPGMDPNLRSAVSIARRLQDPLLEYVKIEPKHLGVGSYQHDVSETQLKKTLDSIVEECVSFVGVDLNVCPEVLLRKISGLSASRAKQIVEWRKSNSCFVNRRQLLEVKGLGQKSFEQCAGFVKILPETCPNSRAQTQNKKTKEKHVLNPLDRTIIHPESYDLAERFLKEIGGSGTEVGQQTLVNKVKKYMTFKSAEDVANTFCVPVADIQLIIDAFSHLQDFDLRQEFDQPLFHTSIRSFTDLQVNQELTGRVTNMTAFGAFVDAGVGTDGLIHVSKMRRQTLNVGDRVKVRVLDINLQKKRLGLELML